MGKKFIQNIQKLIEEKDPKKDLGLVSEGNIKHFQAKPPALVSNPVPTPDPSEELPTPVLQNNKNFTWEKESFTHNRGAFKDLILEDFLTIIKKSKTTINSVTGNLSDYIVGDNKNIKYTIQVVTSAPITLTITPFVNNSVSLSVYTAFSFSSASKVFTSGTERYVPSNINMNLNQTGLWTITILLYQEKGNTAFNILDQLGSFVEAASESIFINDQKLITFDTTRGNNGIESIFIDGAFGPSLSNVIYWNKLDNFTEEFGGGELAGYGLYTVVNERLSNDVVSGWGTDAFAVTGSKLPLFPIAATLGIPGPASITYKISGTEFDTGANRTIVTVSGTAFSGAGSDPIYIERTLHLTDILQDDTLGSVVSGTHFNVKVGDQYTYEVDTFNSFGNRGPRSVRISGTAGDINPPGLVTSLAGTGSLKAIKLTWTNPTNIDLKGVHVFDTPTVISGTTKPIATIIKGSNTTIPEEVVINSVSSGTLIDQWPYDLYIATFDHAGNSSTENMPTVSVTTDVEIKTSRENQRIELDTVTNQLRFFDVNDKLIVKIGEDIAGSTPGMALASGTVTLTQTNPDEIPLFIFTIKNEGNQLLQFDNLSSEIQTDSAQLGLGAEINAIFGRINETFTFSRTNDYIAIHGQYDGESLENAHSFSGKFTGAKVFCDSGLIVSGSTGIKSEAGFQDLDGDTRIQVEESTDDDIIRFDTAGTERARITNAGTIQLGTSTLNSLQIVQGTTIPTRRGIGLPTDPDGQMRFYVHSFQASAKFEFFDGNTGARRFAIESNIISGSGDALFEGDVGIGTTTPGEKLSVEGVISGSGGIITNAGQTVFNESGANVDFRIESDVDTDSFFIQGSQGNIGFGTSTFDGTAFGAIAIANGTAPGAGTANQSYIYTKDISASSELFAMNEAGTEFQLTSLLVNTIRITGNTTLNATNSNVFCDTDGGILTVSLPAGVDGTYYRIINVGSSGNDVTITPNGSELLEGVNGNKLLLDGSVVVLVFETTEGWW